MESGNKKAKNLPTSAGDDSNTTHAEHLEHINTHETFVDIQVKDRRGYSR